MKPVKRTCALQGCGRTFVANRDDARFCTPACRARASRKRKADDGEEGGSMALVARDERPVPVSHDKGMGAPREVSAMALATRVAPVQAVLVPTAHPPTVPRSRAQGHTPTPARIQSSAPPQDRGAPSRSASPKSSPQASGKVHVQAAKVHGLADDVIALRAELNYVEREGEKLANRVGKIEAQLAPGTTLSLRREVPGEREVDHRAFRQLQQRVHRLEQRLEQLEGMLSVDWEERILALEEQAEALGELEQKVGGLWAWLESREAGEE